MSKKRRIACGSVGCTSCSISLGCVCFWANRYTNGIYLENWEEMWSYSNSNYPTLCDAINLWVLNVCAKHWVNNCKQILEIISCCCICCSFLSHWYLQGWQPLKFQETYKSMLTFQLWGFRSLSFMLTRPACCPYPQWQGHVACLTSSSLSHLNSPPPSSFTFTLILIMPFRLFY